MSILTRAAVLVFRQQRKLRQRDEEIYALKARIILNELEYVRNARDLLSSFIELIEDENVREPLIQGLSDLQDQIARMEEYVG